MSEFLMMLMIGCLMVSTAGLIEVKRPNTRSMAVAVTGLSGMLLSVVAVFGLVFQIPNPAVRAGVLVACVAALVVYLVAWARHRKNMRAYDRHMTMLMNSIPPEQRYGYTEDFPEDTKWHM
jgi:uncharacterized YccA/Bax inhibitor family protein